MAKNLLDEDMELLQDLPKELINILDYNLLDESFDMFYNLPDNLVEIVDGKRILNQQLTKNFAVLGPERHIYLTTFLRNLSKLG